MSELSFNRDWTLTIKQAEKLAEVLEKPPTRTITDEQSKKFTDSLHKAAVLIDSGIF